MNDAAAGRRNSRNPSDVIRSEEELRTSTRKVVTGRVRLSKRIVTQTVTETREVRQEELVIEHLDADGSTLTSPTEAAVVGTSATQSGDGDVEIVLVREELVVTKVLVPYERITVYKDIVTEQRPITENLRQERIEVSER